MRKGTYYIEIDSYWQDSQSSFVGPFESRAEAQAWFNLEEWEPDHNVWASTGMCGGDIRTAYRIYPEPLSKTEARRRGLRDRGEADNTIPPTIQPNARALARWCNDDE